VLRAGRQPVPAGDHMLPVVTSGPA